MTKINGRFRVLCSNSGAGQFVGLRGLFYDSVYSIDVRCDCFNTIR